MIKLNIRKKKKPHTRVRPCSGKGKISSIFPTLIIPNDDPNVKDYRARTSYDKE